MNAHGAHIYQDENGNYYYRVGDVATPAPERVDVFYNVDCYVDRIGSQYRNADDPDAVDAYGEMPTVVEGFDVEECRVAANSNHSSTSKSFCSTDSTQQKL